MAYNDKVIEHYENPRNVGKLDKNDLAKEAGYQLHRFPEELLTKNAVKAAVADWRKKKNASG